MAARGQVLLSLVAGDAESRLHAPLAQTDYLSKVSLSAASAPGVTTPPHHQYIGDFTPQCQTLAAMLVLAICGYCEQGKGVITSQEVYLKRFGSCKKNSFRGFLMSVLPILEKQLPASGPEL